MFEGNGEYGDGYGYGYGFLDGYGYGDEYGDGYRNEYGNVEYGDGYGDEYGDGNGEYGDRYSNGDGYRNEYENGEYEYGCEDIKLTFNAEDAFEAYHFIAHDGLGNFFLRNGKVIKAKQHLHEDKIKMCEYGFHSSLSIKDARVYAPKNAVLTKVKVWGDVIFYKDKLVSTDRMIVEVLDERV